MTTTFTDQFATEYAKNAVPAMLKAIDSVRRYNRFVLLGALATSYLHQAHYLWTQKASYFAYLVPLIFDAAMVSMLIVVRTPGIARDAKRVALVVFTGAALLSATINFAAPGTIGLRLVFALVVVLVIGVEFVAGRIRPDFAAIEAQAAELLSAAKSLQDKTNTIEDSPANQPSAAVSPSTTTATPQPVTVSDTAVPAPGGADVLSTSPSQSPVDVPADPATTPARPVPARVPTPDELADRITRPRTTSKPTVSTAASTRSARPGQPRPSGPGTTAPSLAPSTTDTPVTESDAAQLTLPVVPPDLLNRARHVATQYRTEHGTPITAGQLAARLRVNSDQASQALAVLDLGTDNLNQTITTVNGNRPKGTAR